MKNILCRIICWKIILRTEKNSSTLTYFIVSLLVKLWHRNNQTRVYKRICQRNKRAKWALSGLIVIQSNQVITFWAPFINNSCKLVRCCACCSIYRWLHPTTVDVLLDELATLNWASIVVRNWERIQFGHQGMFLNMYDVQSGEFSLIIRDFSTPTTNCEISNDGMGAELANKSQLGAAQGSSF